MRMDPVPERRQNNTKFITLTVYTKIRGLRACHNGLSKTILQGTSKGERRRARHRKYWMVNVKEWTSLPMPELLAMASRLKDWNRISAEASLKSNEDPVGKGTELNYYA